MRITRELLIAGIIAVMLFCGVLCSGTDHKAVRKDDSISPISVKGNRVQGEYIVTVHNDLKADFVRKLFSSFGVIKVRSIGNNIYLIKLRNDPGLSNVRRKGMESSMVKYVQPNYIYRIDPPRKKRSIRID